MFETISKLDSSCSLVSTQDVSLSCSFNAITATDGGVNVVGGRSGEKLVTGGRGGKPPAEEVTVWEPVAPPVKGNAILLFSKGFREEDAFSSGFKSPDKEPWYENTGGSFHARS